MLSLRSFCRAIRTISAFTTRQHTSQLRNTSSTDIASLSEISFGPLRLLPIRRQYHKPTATLRSNTLTSFRNEMPGVGRSYFCRPWRCIFTASNRVRALSCYLQKLRADITPTPRHYSILHRCENAIAEERQEKHLAFLGNEICSQTFFILACDVKVAHSATTIDVTCYFIFWG